MTYNSATLVNDLQDVEMLTEKFERIHNYGWIKSLHNGTGAIGRTIETLLGLDENTLQIPDYGNIEIKTHTTNSDKPIGLFKATFDNTFFEAKRIKDTYGYPDKVLKKCKVLNGNVYGNRCSFIGLRYKFQLYVDWNTKRVYLLIFDKFNTIVDSSIYWTFSLLKERLYGKLRLLAYIEASQKFIGVDKYFYYKSIEFYQLKGFNTFLHLIEDGKIVVKLCLSVFRAGKRKGQMHDHGTCFSIHRDDLNLLFTKYEASQLAYCLPRGCK